MSTPLVFTRLVAESDGGSRFEDFSVPVTQKDFAPPARPFGVSPLEDAAQTGFLHLPVGWSGEMHPTPIRMWIFVLAGEMRFAAANGDSRHLRPGDALLLEDTSGPGHESRVLGDAAVTLAIVRLPDPGQAGLGEAA